LVISLGSAVQAQNRALPGQGGLPGPENPLTVAPLIGPGSLGTGYVFSSGWCGGPYIDLTAAAGSAVAVTGFQMFFKGTVNRTVFVYWKAGTYVGSENTPGAWTLLGSVNVTPGGDGTLTSVAIGGVTIPAGQTYGIKVWDGGTGGTDGPGLDLRLGGTSASDANLSLTSNAYTCNTTFESPSSNFGWQGNVLYTDGVVVPTMGTWMMAALFVMLSGLAVLVIRRRDRLTFDAT
jgi:hypothetical protein